MCCGGKLFCKASRWSSNRHKTKWELDLNFLAKCEAHTYYYSGSRTVYLKISSGAQLLSMHTVGFSHKLNLTSSLNFCLGTWQPASLPFLRSFSQCKVGKNTFHHNVNTCQFLFSFALKGHKLWL